MAEVARKNLLAVHLVIRMRVLTDIISTTSIKIEAIQAIMDLAISLFEAICTILIGHLQNNILAVCSTTDIKAAILEAAWATAVMN